MTRHHDFKMLVRERMKKTGERYTAARAHLLQSGSSAATRFPGLFQGYDSFGGICRDTGALRNVLAAAGVVAPHTRRAMSEALVTGLCGGVGFLYAVFEYKGWPPMLSVMCRFDTMPDGYVAGGIERLGLAVKVSETTSATAARKALDAAIAAGKPALCVVDLVGLAPPGTGGPMAMAGVAPTVVAVAGVDGDELLLDDGGVAPRRMSHADFARARALYKKGRHRLVTIERVKDLDVVSAVRGAAAATAKRYFDAPFKGFASNFGFAGMEKWQRLLTDAKDKKGWGALFPEGRLAYLALRRAYDGIESDFTAPAAGRPLFAEFLGEAAAITGDDAFARSAALFRRAGEGWSAISGAIAACGDAAVEKGCTLGDSACELFDQADCDRMRETARVSAERMALAQTCTMTRERSAEIYADLAKKLGDVVAVEREAVSALSAARG